MIVRLSSDVINNSDSSKGDELVSFNPSHLICIKGFIFHCVIVSLCYPVTIAIRSPLNPQDDNMHPLEFIEYN